MPFDRLVDHEDGIASDAGPAHTPEFRRRGALDADGGSLVNALEAHTPGQRA